MKITDVQIRKLFDDSELKAIASMTIDDMFVIHDIKVVEGEKGIYVSLPPIAQPVSPQINSTIAEVVIRSYQSALADEELSLKQ
ncbi:septation protein spovg [Heliomicrobium modesticaldum Ice1]|uniref:Septation protein spovg n=1 Tax=Heliobacterium modesticaldum (strain ATCC 51547 / Ice1) TaxID=498761 RepID=B0TAH4_HELMI|nr:SpoVG family protein [Heliomicrobium modesticaldum]ABZ85024.1 septation protein spovg [Heliomicrobium modesticaldum Ice1]